jgi:hypothetical protein
VSGAGVDCSGGPESLLPAGSEANRAHMAPDTGWADGSSFLAEQADDSARERAPGD